MAALRPGYATRHGTEVYAKTLGKDCAPGHYSDFLNLHLALSSLGIGTFPGAATDAVDEGYAQVVEAAALAGINVFDTAAHYRYGRSARALGEGLKRAFARGVAREQIFAVAKGGFLAFPDGVPANPEAWIDANIAARGLGARAELTGRHLISPAYLAAQIDEMRTALGLETLDAFLLDQPEVHIPAIGKERTHRKIAAVFEVFEEAVRAGKIRAYGISTFDGLRVETDAPLFQSITSLLGLAERAAQAVGQAVGQAAGETRAAKHAFRVIQLPFNQAMTEGFTRFSQATGQGNVASSVQAAHQLRVYVMASHSLGKGLLARECADAVAAALPDYASHAQRALQFNRSTPGIGTSLVGVSTPGHLADLLAVAQRPPLAKAEYLKLYARAGDA
ncbi:MAG: aldo/keto reductase [Burkholderiales bacterium]|nr:aldo/keto reductase [Burkholderiales bacterium]